MAWIPSIRRSIFSIQECPGCPSESGIIHSGSFALSITMEFQDGGVPAYIVVHRIYKLIYLWRQPSIGEMCNFQSIYQSYKFFHIIWISSEWYSTSLIVQWTLYLINSRSHSWLHMIIIMQLYNRYLLLLPSLKHTFKSVHNHNKMIILAGSVFWKSPFLCLDEKDVSSRLVMKYSPI